MADRFLLRAINSAPCISTSWESTSRRASSRPQIPAPSNFAPLPFRAAAVPSRGALDCRQQQMKTTPRTPSSTFPCLRPDDGRSGHDGGQDKDWPSPELTYALPTVAMQPPKGRGGEGVHALPVAMAASSTPAWFRRRRLSRGCAFSSTYTRMVVIAVIALLVVLCPTHPAVAAQGKVVRPRRAAGAEAGERVTVDDLGAAAEDDKWRRHHSYQEVSCSSTYAAEGVVWTRVLSEGRV